MLAGRGARVWIPFCWALLLLGLAVGARGQPPRPAATAPRFSPEHPVVLVLSSWQDGMLVPEGVNDSLASTLIAGGLPLNDLFIENLDLVRNDRSDYRSLLAEELRKKLASRRVTMIVVEGLPALRFLRSEGRDLGKGVPVLTVLIRNEAMASEREQPVFQLAEQADCEGTLRAVFALFPRTRHVLLVGGAQGVGTPSRGEVETALAPWRGQVDFESTEGLSYGEMLARVARVRSDTIIFVAPYFADATGRPYAPVDVLEEVSRVAPAPVFGTHREWLGHGMVGGALTTSEATGRQAARLVLDFLQGRLAPTAPVTTFTPPAELVFDWEQLSRWHVDPSLLPKGSLVINPPSTPWVRYRGIIIAAAVTFAVLLVLVVALTILNRRLRQMTFLAHEGEARFRVMVESAPEAILVYDPRVRLIVDCNGKAERLLGCVRERLVNAGMERFYAARQPDGMELNASMEMHCARALEGEEVVFERVISLEGGREFPCEVRLTRLPLQGRDMVRASLVDVSERRRAEEERRVLEARLQQAHKMESLGSLAGGIAHDMNNVLAAILALASAHLHAHPAGSPTRKAFGTIVKAAERGGKMVAGLLNFARSRPAEERDLDVNALIREEVLLLERTTLSKVQLEMDLARDLRPMRGDGGALSQAIMNLCVNAVDAMPEGGLLALRTRNVDHDRIEIRVEDTGCGMPPDVQARALDPFFTTKEVGKGTGLGLSMVYGTVKLHHGQLDVASEVGGGTCVIMRFPACREPLPPDVEVSGPDDGEVQGLHVLLVDDDELVQASTESVLSALGHVTTMVSRGEEALDALEGGLEPDVVILDMNMPGLGGGGTLPRLRALRESLPILLATGRADETALALARSHSHVTLLAKPFTMEILRENLVRACRS